MGLGYARTTQSATGRRAVGLWRVLTRWSRSPGATPGQSLSSNRANERPFERQDDSPRLGRSIMARMSPHISIDRDAVSAFCRRHHITRLALFGSVLRDDFRPDSDIDVLVEFQPGHVPGLDFVSIEREFSGLLQGRRVDMVTPKFLNPRIRDQVLRNAEPLYVVT